MMPSLYRTRLVNDSMIDAYVLYRKTCHKASPPVFFDQWFDNLWQAEPVYTLISDNSDVTT